LRAQHVWRTARVELVETKIDVARCDYQVTRARAVDHHLLGTDTYDAAEYRMQLAEHQERWRTAELHSAEAQAALTRAQQDLATAKQTYADLVRTGPTAPVPESTTHELARTWDPRAERDRTHRLHFKHASAYR